MAEMRGAADTLLFLPFPPPLCELPLWSPGENKVKQKEEEDRKRGGTPKYCIRSPPVPVPELRERDRERERDAPWRPLTTQRGCFERAARLRFGTRRHVRRCGHGVTWCKRRTQGDKTRCLLMTESKLLLTEEQI